MKTEDLALVYSHIKKKVGPGSAFAIQFQVFKRDSFLLSVWKKYIDVALLAFTFFVVTFYVCFVDILKSIFEDISVNSGFSVHVYQNVRQLYLVVSMTWVNF